MISTRLYEIPIVYFIQGEITKRVKIGKTNTAVSERLRILQTGSPDILNFIGGYFGNEYSESYLHELFSESRLHGEWFLPEKRIFDFIYKNCFKNEVALNYAYIEIRDGNMTYEQALRIGDEKLLLSSEENDSTIISNMYYVNGRSILDR